jgi:hypothetical protein
MKDLVQVILYYSIVGCSYLYSPIISTPIIVTLLVANSGLTQHSFMQILNIIRASLFTRSFFMHVFGADSCSDQLLQTSWISRSSKFYGIANSPCATRPLVTFFHTRRSSR